MTTPTSEAADVRAALAWAVVDDGAVDVATIASTRRAAIVNWLVVAHTIAIYLQTSDEQVERLWETHRETAVVQQVNVTVLAALDAAPEPVAGWKMVPVALTMEMRGAAVNAAAPAKIGDPPLYERMWLDMLAAAPPPPASAGQGETLWCCHVRGPDDVHAAPDYETALRWADVMNACNWHKHVPSSFEDCLVKAVPAVWPWSAEAHAEDLPKSIRGFTPRNELPPDDPDYRPTPPQHEQEG